MSVPANEQHLRLADWLTGGAIAVTIGASMAGLLLDGAYRDDDELVELLRADDSFRLLVLSPLVGAGLIGARRGWVVARLVGLGGLLALGYLYAFVAFGAAIGPLTLAHIAALGLASWAILIGFLGLEPAAVDHTVAPSLPRRATAWFLVAIAGLSAVQWTATIAATVASGEQPADLAVRGWATNPLYTIELAFLVPLFAAAGLELLRRRPVGGLLAVPLLVLLALLGLGLAWEAGFTALGGRPLDAGTAVAGLGFFAVPAALLGGLAAGLRRASAGARRTES